MYHVLVLFTCSILTTIFHSHVIQVLYSWKPYNVDKVSLYLVKSHGGFI